MLVVNIFDWVFMANACLYMHLEDKYILLLISRAGN